MSRWPRGEAEIEQLIASKQLQQVIGGQTNGEHLLQKASRTLDTAGEIANQDPDSAYVLAYDAALTPAPRSLPTRACAQQRQAATMQSRWLFVPSWGRAGAVSSRSTSRCISARGARRALVCGTGCTAGSR